MPDRVNIVLPIKHPRNGKTRLKNLLNTRQRVDLILNLFARNLTVIRNTFPDISILVVTDESFPQTEESQQLLAIARHYHARILQTPAGKGLNSTLDLATDWTIEQGFDSQLIVLPDIACLSAVDLNLLMTQPRCLPSLYISPANDNGTNAVLSTPPNAIQHCFGPQSSRHFQARARAMGIPCRVLNLRGLQLDIDTPEDFHAWCQNSSPVVSPAGDDTQYFLQKILPIKEVC